MSKASDLIYEYVRAEVKIEEAEKAMIEMAGKKESLLQEILANDSLKSALMTTGVTISNKVCHLDEVVGGGYEVVVYDEPVNAFSLFDEPEEMESGDE